MDVDKGRMPASGTAAKRLFMGVFRSLRQGQLRRLRWQWQKMQALYHGKTMRIAPRLLKGDLPPKYE
jgi:hypothetical protein